MNWKLALIAGGISAIACSLIDIVTSKKADDIPNAETPRIREGKMVFIGDQKPDKGFLVIPKDENPEDILNEVKDDVEDLVKVVPSVNGGITLAEAVAAIHKYTGYSDLVLVDETDYMSLPEDERHACTYFVLDDILAGMDDALEEIPPTSELYTAGVNELMVNDLDAVFLMGDGVGYEIVRSDGNYLAEYIRANGKEEDDV